MELPKQRMAISAKSIVHIEVNSATISKTSCSKQLVQLNRVSIAESEQEALINLLTGFKPRVQQLLAHHIRH
jgi:hypothetical protein